MRPRIGHGLTPSRPPPGGFAALPGPLFGFAMTNSQPHLKPTPRQLRYLKDLAIRTGGSFTYPQTFAEADAQIKRLRKRRRTRAPPTVAARHAR